jgi:hypothetical protein
MVLSSPPLVKHQSASHRLDLQSEARLQCCSFQFHGDSPCNKVCTITAHDAFTHFTKPTRPRNRLHTTQTKNRQDSRTITTDMNISYPTRVG